jgi:hypothetical protein
MCCGARKSLRSSQAPSKPKEKSIPVVRRVSRDKNAAVPASVERQHIVKRKECPKCGYTTMLVHMAGRERQQCTNTECRFITQ